MSINKDSKKAPNLRFKGFTDDWEQRKLQDVSERVRGNDGRMELPTLTISARKGWLDQRDRFSGNIAGKEQRNYTLLSENELSYNKGNSKLAKYGVVFKLSAYKEALVPRVYHSFRTNKEADPDYIEYMFATKLPDRELGKLVTSGARMDGLLNINYDDFIGIKIKIPSLAEQRKISILFIQLDNLITLHQRKLDQLNQLKESLLQQMFPGKGETVPKLRFAGFEGDWEERKLGEIAPLRGGYAFESDKFTDVGIPIIRISNILSSGNVEGSFAYYKEGENDSKYTLEDKSILIAMSGATTGKISILHNENKDKYYQNQRVGYFQKTTKADYDFIATLLKTTAFPQKLTSLLVSGAQPNVSASDIDNLNFRIPASISEQFKIGDYISKLNKIINKQNLKIESLQSMKQVLLQNMFI